MALHRRGAVAGHAGGRQSLRPLRGAQLCRRRKPLVEGPEGCHLLSHPLCRLTRRRRLPPLRGGHRDPPRRPRDAPCPGPARPGHRGGPPGHPQGRQPCRRRYRDHLAVPQLPRLQLLRARHRAVAGGRQVRHGTDRRRRQDARGHRHRAGQCRAGATVEDRDPRDQREGHAGGQGLQRRPRRGLAGLAQAAAGGQPDHRQRAHPPGVPAYPAATDAAPGSGERPRCRARTGPDHSGLDRRRSDHRRHPGGHFLPQPGRRADDQLDAGQGPRPAPGVAVPDRRRKLAGGGHAADRADPQRRDRRRPRAFQAGPAPRRQQRAGDPGGRADPSRRRDHRGGPGASRHDPRAPVHGAPVLAGDPRCVDRADQPPRVRVSPADSAGTPGAQQRAARPDVPRPGPVQAGQRHLRPRRRRRTAAPGLHPAATRLARGRHAGAAGRRRVRHPAGELPGGKSRGDRRPSAQDGPGPALHLERAAVQLHRQRRPGAPAAGYLDPRGGTALRRYGLLHGQGKGAQCSIRTTSNCRCASAR